MRGGMRSLRAGSIRRREAVRKCAGSPRSIFCQRAGLSTSQDVRGSTTPSWQGRPAARLPLHPSRPVALLRHRASSPPAKRPPFRSAIRRGVPAPCRYHPRPGVFVARPATTVVAGGAQSGAYAAPEARARPFASGGDRGDFGSPTAPIEQEREFALLLHLHRPTVRRLDAASVALPGCLSTHAGRRTLPSRVGSALYEATACSKVPKSR